jgi:8-oxo-dGTP pyrophosphatase MutT (NUDIX family)
MPQREGKAVDGFVVHEVAADVVVRVVRAMPELPAAVDREVERLWQAASRRVAADGAGQMFNGRVFSADTFTPHLVTGHLTEYRRVVAQMERPELFTELGVRSFAVCGVLRCADGVVVGRRHRGAIYQAGMWQLPPAGSVDAEAAATDGKIDLCRQLLRELREELGLAPDAVGEPWPLCIVEHPGSHVSDLGLLLVTGLSAEAVLTAHQVGGDTEYEEILVVPVAGLAAFLAKAGEGLVPPAREFLIRAGLTNREPDSSR